LVFPSFCSVFELKISTKFQHLNTMQSIHYRFVLRKPLAESGKWFIYLYCNINSRIRYYSTQLYIDPGYWDDRNQRPKPGAENYTVILQKIDSINSQLSSILVRKQLSGSLISLNDISSIFRSGKTSTNLVEWMELYLEQYSNRYTKQSLKTYKAQISKLKVYSSFVEFETIDINWWRRYEKYLISKGNIETTRHKTFKHLKCFINKAIEAGIIDKNSWQYLKVKAGESTRQFLTMQDLVQLEKIRPKLKSQKLVNVWSIFLFSCFTGLRYSDIKSLEWSNIEGDHLTFKTQKTRKNEIIPLSKKAQSLLPPPGSGKVFKVYSNQKVNQYVKELVTMAGIQKRISFHCARHTFATISLELSGDIATVSKLLGHSAISTTQIYAKVLDRSKQAVISQWDKAIS